MSAHAASLPTPREVAPTASPPAGGGVARRIALRRAVRAAVVIPAAFAFTLLVIRDAQVATFTVFGCFALLVLSDFGGPRRARAVAFVAATLAGAGLVALGTLASATVASGAVVMLVVGFVLSFAGVFGGYLAAAQTGLLLAFVLSVAVPANATLIGTRLAGWTLAGAVSTLAGLFFWPWFEMANLDQRAAAACLAVADLVEALQQRPPDERLNSLREAARAALRAVRAAYAHSGRRPAGPTRRDRAFVELVNQLAQIVDLTERPFSGVDASLGPRIRESSDLEVAVTTALRASAAAFTGGPPPDIRAVDAARRANRTALDRWAAEELRAGRAPEEVLRGIDAGHTLRVLAYLTLAVSANAVILAGGRPDPVVALPAATPQLSGVRGIAANAARTVRAHLEPSSTVLHNSLRVAIGLALSVMLARLLGVGHGFWVVLGTLSVLRSNALGTGRSTVQAIEGSILGFVVGGAFAVVAGGATIAIWLVLPIVLFFASYAATAIGFVAGQTAFTVTVIIIFNLLSPAGWQVGLVRIEDVALGTAISVVVGVLFWPRGARQDLAHAVAGVYRAAAAYLQRASDMVLGVAPAGDVMRLRAEVVRARDRAGEAFDVFLNERGAKPLDADTAGRLLAAGNQMLLAGDLLLVVAGEMGYSAASCPDGAAVVQVQVRALLAAIIVLAGELAGEPHQGGPLQPPSTEALSSAAIDCVRRAGGDERALRGAMAVVIADEWVQNIARFAADVRQPVQAAEAAASIRWWR